MKSIGRSIGVGGLGLLLFMELGVVNAFKRGVIFGVTEVEDD